MNLHKSNIVLLVVAVVLAIPTSIQLYFDSESFVDYSRIPLMFDGFTADNVATIQLAVPKKEQPAPNPQTPDQKVQVQYDQLVLQRTDKGWQLAPPNTLAGAPVMKQRVETDVFDHLTKIRVDEQTLIQANATPEQLAEYGLDEAQATLIRAVDQSKTNVVAALYIGHDAAGKLSGTDAVRGVFVRKQDSNDVVLYEFEKGWRRDIATDQWVDRVLLQVAPETVTGISISNAASQGKSIAFTRTENKASWVATETPEGRGAVRQTEVEGILGRLRYIAVQEYRQPLQNAGNLAALGLLPPQIEVELTYKQDGAQRTAKFQVGNRADGEQNVHYLTSTEAPFLMTWPAGMVTALEIDVAQAWFDPAGPVPPPEDPKDDGKKPDPGKEDGKKD